jgi:hypothetical protein
MPAKKQKTSIPDDVVIGVIGGSGLYGMEGIEDTQEIEISTPFGAPVRCSRAMITLILPPSLTHCTQCRFARFRVILTPWESSTARRLLS